MAEFEQENEDGGEENGILLRRQVNADGAASPEYWRQAMADYVQLGVDGGSAWVELGPSPLVAGPDTIAFGQNLDPVKYSTTVSGLVTDIAIDPSGGSDSILYLSTSGGGIWKSLDGGQTWQAKTDGMPSLSMGSVAIDPGDSRTIYAGTGPIFGSRSLVYYRRVGLYKSIDGGETWWIADGGFFGTVLHDSGINRIVLPAPGVVLAATDAGLFRSVDGGQNFGNNAAFNNGKPLQLGGADAPQARVRDLHLDTRDAGVVYAGVAGAGIFRSTDGGATFPTNIFNTSDTAPKPYGDVVFVQSMNPDNQTIYASVQYVKSYRGLYKSTDGGKSWSLKPGGKAADSEDEVYGPAQSQYDLTMGVDPRDPARVYIGLQSLWLSVDGGDSFQRCDSQPVLPAFNPASVGPLKLRSFPVHVDHHALTFSPQSHWAADDPARSAILAAKTAKYTAIVNDPATTDRVRRFYQKLLGQLAAGRTTVYVGNDGGAYRNVTPDIDLADWQNLNDGGIGTTLIYGIDMARGKSPTQAQTYVGMQDNGTAAIHGAPANDGSAFPTRWTEVVGGDGAQVAVDPTVPDVVYAMVTGGLNRTLDSGVNWTSLATSFDTSDAAWYERALAIERTQASAGTRRVWVGVGKRLYRSDDGGGSFVEAKKFDRTIICIATQPMESTAKLPGEVWVGLEQGEVHHSADAGANWDAGSFQQKTGGTGDVECVAIDPADPRRAAAVLSGYSQASAVYRTRHVFLTTDGGQSWADIGGTDGAGPVGNVPDMPVNAVVITAASIIVATASGALVTRDKGATWKQLGVGLPFADCTCLAYDGTVTPPVLRIGTYGRGCWELLAVTGPRIAVQANATFGVVPVGGSATQTITIWNAGGAPLDITAIDTSALPPEISFSSPPPATLTLAPGERHDLTLAFSPAAAANSTGFLALKSNDPNSGRANWKVFVSGAGTTSVSPRIGLQPRALYFGATTTSVPHNLAASVLNAGTAPAAITGFNVASGDKAFGPPVGPSPPQNIPTAGKLDYTVSFKPTPAYSLFFSTGKFQADYQVTGNDPRSPLTLPAFGTRIGGAYPVLDILLILVGIGLVILAIEAIKELAS